MSRSTRITVSLHTTNPIGALLASIATMTTFARDKWGEYARPVAVRWSDTMFGRTIDIEWAIDEQTPPMHPAQIEMKLWDMVKSDQVQS